jgi:hypothetical protein
MPNTTHTPGPWTWLNDTNNARNDNEMDRAIGIQASDPGRDGSWVAVIEGDVFPIEEQEANARLIAASPCLLEALELTEAAHDDDTRIAASRARKAALSKARGGQGE